MADSTVLSGPRDAEVMEAILKEMGVSEYDPMVVHQMLEFTYRYITNVLEDAKVYSEHAKKKEIDVSDVQLAIEAKMNHSFTPPPPRELLLEVARQKNTTPLPLIPDKFGIRLPPERYCLTSNNYSLKKVKKQAVSGPNVTSATFRQSTNPLPSIKSTTVQMGSLANIPASLLQNVLKAQIVPSNKMLQNKPTTSIVTTRPTGIQIKTDSGMVTTAGSPMLSMPNIAGVNQMAGKKRPLESDNT